VYGICLAKRVDARAKAKAEACVGTEAEAEACIISQN
nr:hypothetical protein [Tanacetum cinerariifolium]